MPRQLQVPHSHELPYSLQLSTADYASSMQATEPQDTAETQLQVSGSP